ncbi:MAG: hypothetical protein COA78_33110 [Blastopirellula sp.]|nr:MAG: hypothetical protein COA78_33110 [Blastopirellula sp.]
MNAPKIIAFAGSARKDSFNKALVKIAAKGAALEGASVTLLDLKDYPLPLFDEDLEKEQGTPENAVKLKQLFASHDGFLIASPEYNSSISPLLKNTIDWASRPAEGEPPMIAYKGKTAAIMSASPGGLGGLRGLVHVRSILSSIGVLMLPEQIAIPSAYQAFDESGNLIDEKKQQRVEGLGKLLTDTISKLNV